MTHLEAAQNKLAHAIARLEKVQARCDSPEISMAVVDLMKAHFYLHKHADERHDTEKKLSSLKEVFAHFFRVKNK